MNSKEMIPAPAPGMRMIDTYCKPEWDLLCRIRVSINLILKAAMRARVIRMKLKGILANMDDEFSDWPEDSK